MLALGRHMVRPIFGDGHSMRDSANVNTPVMRSWSKKIKGYQGGVDGHESA